MLRRNTPARGRSPRTLIRAVAAPLALVLLAACSTAVHAAGAPAAASGSTSAVPSSTSAAPTPVTSSASPVRLSTPPTKPNPAPKTSAAETHGQALPLSATTGSATEVITVVAGSASSTTAVLQAWTKAPGGWLRHGGAITAHLGSAGLTTHPSESLSATPIGSFTLTEAFGHDSNPGTAIPYHQTSPADWWISQYGGAYASIYNTMQTCSSSCPFNTAASGPNEHLYYETPFYNYAVVINYNTDPVVQGAGSAFFLHVTNGAPTAGCVSIPQASLVAIMQWLTPADHPRILIGLG